ncbi:MAG: hypothetical protein WBC33_03535, partial [Conexibacter sp.]
MRNRRAIIGVVFAAVLLVAAVSAFAYDHSRRGTIADGIRIGSIDIGGMDAAAARAELSRRLLPALRQPVVATYEGRRFVLGAHEA